MSVAIAEARPKEKVLWKRMVLERLHRIFALILVLQLIQPFQEYWWPETYKIIYLTLAAYGVTELLFSRRLWLRFLLQAAGSVGATLIIAETSWVSWPETRDWASIRSFFAHNLGEFHPFVELALLVLLVCHILSHWTVSKGRAIIVMIMTVTLLAGIDSFFPFELWCSIMWSVAAGLGWLVILHLRMLREMHYESWSAMAERPFELVLPALIVIGLLIVVGILMPKAPSILEDPYTLWLQAQDKELPAFSGEGGTLITNSSSSSGGQASSKSGYGRNDTQIGGGFKYDYSPVMEVVTNQKSYLRGETKAVYTGKGWTDRKGQESAPVATGDPKSTEKLALDPDLGDAVGVRQVEQTVTMLRKDRLTVLFAASPASNVVELDSSRNAQLFWNPEERELRFQRPASVGSYTVVSEVQELDENLLRTISSNDNAGAKADMDDYLQLPDTLPKRVRELALSVSAAATNDYDRLKLLEQYLQSTYPYTNTPDLTKQKSKDVVDAFLFEIQEGYCDYYSTAFVVMARSLGIPTRWVKGYTAGVNPAAEQEQRYGFSDPNGAGTYTVRNADAHSWAEAYFEGYGWVSFEPTSGFSIPVPVPEKEVPQETAPVVDTTTEPVERPSEQAGGWKLPTIVSIVAAIVVIAVAGAWILIRRRGGWKHAIRKLRHLGTTPNQRIVKEMESLVRFMQRRGYKRNKHETLRETFSGWGGRFGSLKPDLEGALVQFEWARYGSGQGDEEAYQEFSKITERIRKAL